MMLNKTRSFQQSLWSVASMMHTQKRSATLFSLAAFSTGDADKHKTEHMDATMHPKYFENDFSSTSIKELEYVRSPFYDLSHAYQSKEGEDATEFITNVQLKLEMTHFITSQLQSQFPNKESVAFTRYADKIHDPETREKLQFPRGEFLKRIDVSKELFRVQKTSDHWMNVRRSKEFIADDFFPPRAVPLDANLQDLLTQEHSLDESELESRLMDIIPNLNHDQVVDLSLYLAFESKNNSKLVWQAIENSALEALHLLSLKQVCQLEWATTQLKPKRTAGRFNQMLIKRAYDEVDRCSALELSYIMQGFRQKANKGLVEKVRLNLIQRRRDLFPNGVETEDGREMLINTLFAFASNRPKNHGVYRRYAQEAVEELIANYEHDLCEAGEQANPEQLTRLAQALYIIQTEEHENIYWRVERRTNQLAHEGKLDAYNATNILRALSRSQKNKMCGQDKTFTALEPIVLANIESIPDRDLCHIMYAYGVRGLGNPDLHKALERRLELIADRLDYPSMFNAVYYLLFRESTNEAVWKKIIANTVAQKDVMPLIYYRPFKASKFWLQQKFPEMNLEDYVDKFYNAEQYFNVTKFDDLFESDIKYAEFKAFLTGHCHVYPSQFCSISNMFNLHFVFWDHKIAINYHLNKFTKSSDQMPSEMHKLPAKMLKGEGWQIYDLSEKEFNSWDYVDRVNNIKDWLKAAHERQIENGVLPRDPPQYV